MNDYDDNEFEKPLKMATALNYLKVEDVPQLPESLDVFNFQKLLPKGFEDQATILLDGETIIIRCLKPENPEYTDVTIRPALYNSLKASTVVPRFLFEKSTISAKSLDYLKADKNLVLNINQMIYLLIAHRLTYFKSYNQQFIFLLQQDINNLANYLEYVTPVTFNAKAKANNTFVIIPASAHQEIFPYGNFLVNCRPSEEDWAPILRDIGKYVQPSSDSAMHKRSKIVLAERPIYRSVGYLPNNDGSFYSLFECKQNLPARLKTHYLGDAKRVFNSDISCFQQDCVIETRDGVDYLLSKDETLKKAVIVFAPIEWDTKRFVAGEAEVSANIADTLVVNTDSVNVSFVSKLGIHIKHDVGVEHKVRHDQEIILGYDDELEPVSLPQGVLSYKITKINQANTGGLSKVYFEAVMKAGNARIVSDTGLKFVSKVMTNMGKICVPKRTNLETGKKFAPTVTRYLKDVEESKLANYQRIDVDQFTEHNIDIINPDVILGMNAVKANTSEQCNTIVFAQAALAVEYGYYVPSEKFGFQGLLNSHDIEEINRAAKSLPDFFYLDRFGKRQKVLIGLSHLKFTELGSVYTRFKPQSFAFTSAKNIFQNMPELSTHIYENYLETDKVEIAKELYKVINDPKGRLRLEDKVPRYTPQHIRKNKLFDENDLILKKSLNINKQDSKLLDESWNTKGFYLDLTSYPKGPLIRIPCAKTLNAFVGQLPDGTYSFHGLIVNISKMIQNIIGTQYNNYNMSIGYLYNKATIGKKVKYGEGRLASYDLYMNTIQGALYSNEDSAMMIIQSLIKPKIKGVGMKQVVEPLLPDDVIVITDNRKYNRIVNEANSNGELVIDRETLQALLDEDYDEEVDTLVNLAIDDTSSKEDVDRILNDVPLVLAIRDPSLWERQLCRPRVWNRQHFALYLSRCSQPLDLDEYLSPKHNRDIVLVSSYVALASKSDCDGDRLPIFCLNGEGQALLKKFALNNVLKEEDDWINTYIKKEYNSTKKLLIDTPEKHVYKLFKVSNVFDPKGDPKNYPQYIFNAQLAKGNIGPATIDMWALYMVFECYMAYCQENDFKHYSKDGKFLGKITQVLTPASMKLLSFKQTELVQGNVIEAVKHMEGGSSAFKKYFLDGMTDHNNIDVVRKELTLPYEQGGYNMRVEDANLMLYVVNWAKQSQLLKAVKNFITKYNKGKLPANSEALDMWEDFIQANTFFGSLIQAIFDIKRNVEEKTIEAVAKAKEARELNDTLELSPFADL